jgi:LacI family transcriptional regulator
MISTSNPAMTNKREGVSQQRIARDLGVSQALVSLVLNGKRENISEESYQRIWSHALKMGYRPKGMRLNAEQTHSGVGFILRAGVRLHTQSNFFSHVQHGMHMSLLARGYHSVYLGSEDDSGPRAAKELLRQHNFCGVAVLGQVSQTFIQAIKSVQPNVVLVSYSFPGLCHSVMPNETQAIEQLVSHLTGLGHREIGWIGGDKGYDYNRRRRAGLVEALAVRGLSLNRKFTVEVETGDRLAGWKAAEIFLEQTSAKSRPTACVCVNGSVARGFLNHLMQRGWHVPAQISVVAVDATRLCEEEHPQITGSHSDPEKIGFTAAELLLKDAAENDGVLSDVVLPARLTVRETSGKPAG